VSDYPGLRAAVRAERLAAARASRRATLERLASGRFLLAVNVYGCLFAFGALLNNVVAFLVLHMSPVWSSYIPTILVPIFTTPTLMSLIEYRRREHAARGER
jgi:uncharacterized membrane protein